MYLLSRKSKFDAEKDVARKTQIEHCSVIVIGSACFGSLTFNVFFSSKF